MRAAQFKKLDGVSSSGAHIEPVEDNSSIINGSLLTPSISLFHNLPKIKPRDPNFSKLPADANSYLAPKAPLTTDYENGVQDGQQKASLVYLDTIKLLETALETLNNQYHTIRNEIEASHLQAVSHCLRAILPDLVAKSVGDEIAVTIRELCSSVIQGTIQIHVNPEQSDHIKALIETHKGSDNTFTIVLDNRIQLDSLVAQWDGGGIEFNSGALLQQCLSALDAAHAGLDNIGENGNE